MDKKLFDKLLKFFLSADVVLDYEQHRFYATKIYTFDESLFRDIKVLLMKKRVNSEV